MELRRQQEAPCEGSDELDLDSMQSDELEQVLAGLLVVKYPGVERADIDRFFHALDAGDLDRVGQVEADIALKSAQWKLAALDVDR